MQALSFKLLEQIESFKHKLTDAEYKTFVENLSDINKEEKKIEEKKIEEKKIEEKKDEKEYLITYLKITPELKNPYVNRDQESDDPHTLRYFLDTTVKKVKLKLSLDIFEILQKKPYLPLNIFLDFNVKDFNLSRDISNSEEEMYIYDNDDHECVLIQNCQLILLKIEPFIE